VLFRDVGRGEKVIEPPRDVGVAAGTNRVPEDTRHEPIPGLAPLAGRAIHRGE
jgi:hypothetical protein